jgi:hypothetical protein
MGFRFYKTFFIKFLIFFSFSGLEVSAFDLEDYATTYRASKDAYQTALTTLSAKESAFRTAYNARMTLERVNKVNEKQAALDSGDQDAADAAQLAIDTLDEMKVNSNACGLY